MQERQSGTDGSELLHRLSRVSSEAAWTTNELRDALREGGVDPDRLIRTVLADVKRQLDAAPQSTARPLLGVLQQHTKLPPSAIAEAMQVPVTFLSAVSRYPKVVPAPWRAELARRAAHALRVEPRAVLESLAQPFQYELAASRDTPYSAETVESFEDILARAGMSAEVEQYWRTLAMDDAV